MHSCLCGEGACSRWAACRSCRRLRSFDLDLSLGTQLSVERSQPRCTRQLLHRAGASSLATRTSLHFPSKTAIQSARNDKGHPEVAFVAGTKRSAEAYFFISQPVSSARALPMSASERTVFTPASCSAANFSSAVPLPPEMIAPAWPMRLPGGAVTPAM